MAAQVEKTEKKHTLKPDPYSYQSGFGNHFSSESVPGTLPLGQNSPQQCPGGLYAEQLSGTAFTVPRTHNQRSWLYRIRPSVCHVAYKPAELSSPHQLVKSFEALDADPSQYRWQPREISDEPHHFVQGLRAVCGAGTPSMRAGCAIYNYTANRSMAGQAFYNADGDFLIVPQQGALDIRTELGCLRVQPGEIVVIQRGIVFSVRLVSATSGKAVTKTDGDDVGEPVRGYICEVFAGHFQLPDLGPIGANGLANPRDFCTPVADYERDGHRTPYQVLGKFRGQLFLAEKDHSPFNVVAWHGNYAPYKYNLALFNTMNTVSFDHADPSIFTVLTCPTAVAGVAAVDFVIFPSRWNVSEHSFRPPYFHRNCMSEYMGLIRGVYDAKEGGGFVPGGSSLHNYMSPHGPDVASFQKASTAELRPVKLPDSLAFMFETSYMLTVTPYGQSEYVEKDYNKCWADHTAVFDEAKFLQTQKK